MKKQLVKKLNCIIKEIEEREDQLSDTYHYCFDEWDVEILEMELDEYLDEKEEIEVDLSSL